MLRVACLLMCTLVVLGCGSLPARTATCWSLSGWQSVRHAETEVSVPKGCVKLRAVVGRSGRTHRAWLLATRGTSTCALLDAKRAVAKLGGNLLLSPQPQVDIIWLHVHGDTEERKGVAYRCP